MPAMLRTSIKARKIALKVLGKPANWENKTQLKRDKDWEKILMREDLRRSR